MKTRALMLVMGATLLINACQKDELDVPVTMKAEQFAVPAPRLTDLRWTLARFDRSQELVTAQQVAPWFMLSSGSGNVSGFTGCNEVTGRFDQIRGHLSFVGLAYTRRMCPDVAATEDRYQAVLEATDHFRLEPGVLTLMRGEEELAQFVAR